MLNSHLAAAFESHITTSHTLRVVGAIPSSISATSWAMPHASWRDGDTDRSDVTIENAGSSPRLPVVCLRHPA